VVCIEGVNAWALTADASGLSITAAPCTWKTVGRGRFMPPTRWIDENGEGSDPLFDF
jgi:hypothetical protein